MNIESLKSALKTVAALPPDQRTRRLTQIILESLKPIAERFGPFAKMSFGMRLQLVEDSPAAADCLEKVVLMDPRTVLVYSDNELAAIIAHELAHIEFG